MIGAETSQDIFIEVLNYSDKIGTIALLFFAFVGLHRRWWVPGWMYKSTVERCEKISEEKDAWRETALKASNVATDAFAELRRRT